MWDMSCPKLFFRLASLIVRSSRTLYEIFTCDTLPFLYLSLIHIAEKSNASGETTPAYKLVSGSTADN
jgi:hypothetical protein